MVLIKVWLIAVKFDTAANAAKAAQVLNGRFFAGKSIMALFLAPNIFEKFLP
jgi:hypothetical protein